MRGLEKTAPDGADRHLHGHGDSMTNSAQWGRVGENALNRASAKCYIEEEKNGLISQEMLEAESPCI